jgi:hypothetical protein
MLLAAFATRCSQRATEFFFNSGIKLLKLSYKALILIIECKFESFLISVT